MSRSSSTASVRAACPPSAIRACSCRPSCRHWTGSMPPTTCAPSPNVVGERIGVIGFSHGGWAVLKTVLADLAGQASVKPFAAAVAFYPGCNPPRSPLVTDTLILIGEADDWTPVDRCARWRDAVETNGHSVRMKTYPGALHSFDALAMPHAFAGHYIGRDPDAAADA